MDTISQTPVQTIPDDVWKIICDTVYKYDYLKMDDRAKRLVEKNTQITPFEGGAFIAVGNRFDLYVIPERQGKWNIRREVNKYLAEMAQKYDVGVVKINKRNDRSLRLAKFFGFEEVGHEKNRTVLEKKLWVI